MDLGIHDQSKRYCPAPFSGKLGVETHPHSPGAAMSASPVNRRQFLRSSAAVAAATTLPSWFVQECDAEAQQQPPKSPMEKPGIALVGCGGMGRGDLKNASRFGNVVALCDVDERQLGA